jgi:hypothetical protein
MVRNLVFFGLFTVVFFDATAQGVQFKIPIRIQCDSFIDTLWIGVHGDGPGGSISDNTYSVDFNISKFGPAGKWSEVLTPPDPPGQWNCSAKFVDIPGRTNISDISAGTGLRPFDFRGYDGPDQIDTFAIMLYGRKVSGKKVIISWPNLDSYCTDCYILESHDGQGNFKEVCDMFTVNTYVENRAASGQLDFLIVKEGALAPFGKEKKK